MVNIVMITRDRYRLVSQSLQTLYQHTYREDFTLTIVDDGSEDFRAWSLLQRYGKNANCVVCRVEGSGHVLSQLKNAGAETSRTLFGQGDYLYLSDNDVYFTEGWLGKMLELAHSTHLSGFRLWGGQVHPYHKAIVEAPTLILPDTREYTEHDILDGVSWLMPWSTWDDIGGLDRTTAPGACQSEEYPFCAELKKRGFRIAVAKPHVVIHTGLTHIDGSASPGRIVRQGTILDGVYYE